MLRSALARLVFGLALPLTVSTLNACATPTDADLGEGSEQALSAADPGLRIVLGADGLLSIPAFGTDVERYRGASVAKNETLELVNTGTVARRVVVKFDGPPMLDESHEIHTQDPLLLRPGRAARLPTASNGRYQLLCASGDELVPCPSITIAPGTEEFNWVPTVRVFSF